MVINRFILEAILCLEAGSVAVDEDADVDDPSPEKPSETKSPAGIKTDAATGESAGKDTCRGVGLQSKKNMKISGTVKKLRHE